jgi:PAS domain S-box-containing protein
MRRADDIVEETYWDYSLTPVAGEDGRLVGLFGQMHDRTRDYLAEQRDRLLLQFSDLVRTISTVKEVVDVGLTLLANHLDVARISFGEVETDDRYILIEGCRTSNGLTKSEGVMAIEEVGLAKIIHARGDYVENARDEPALLARGIQSRVVAPKVENGRAVAAILADDVVPRAWNEDQLVLLRSMAARIHEEIRRVRAANALRASEELHRLIFEQARDMIITADLNQRLTACNPAGAEALGIPAEQIVGHSISEFLSSADFERSSSALASKLAQGGTTSYEVNVRAAGGQVRRWDVRSSLLIDEDGQPIGLQAVARDVTEQRAFEQRQQLLIDELNHRVKNTLALVQSFAYQSFRMGKDPQEAQASFQARLATLAAAHDLLTRERWEGATLSALTQTGLEPYLHDGRISFSGPYVALSPKASVSLVLALHELATNATKYGALSIPEGQIRISWEKADDGGFRFSWVETGGPPAIAPERKGFGMRLIERTLLSDIGQKANFDFTKTGLAFTLEGAPTKETVA